MRAMLVATAIALAVSAATAAGYSRKDAQHVTSSRNRAVLDYIVCLEHEVGKTPKRMSIVDSLNTAARACTAASESLPKSADEPSAEDIMIMIMECGFRPGDASPDAGC